MRWVFFGLGLVFWLGKAFPSRLLRGPLPLRAGGVPQRPPLSIRPSPSLVIRFAQDQGSRPSRRFSDVWQHSSLAPARRRPTACVQASRHNRPAWHRCSNGKPGDSRFPHSPLLAELRRCLPPIHEASTRSSTVALRHGFGEEQPSLLWHQRSAVLYWQLFKHVLVTFIEPAASLH
jgi:hypothetical protein